MEKYPQILEDFRKKHPNMNTENLYLCESVDMNGNVIDTKIGVNLLTNYGLNNSFVAGASQNKYIWLGSSGDEPDPASSQLTSYISALGRYSYTAYGTYLPTRYDSETKLFSSDMKVSQCAWDYTAGDNGEYEIWELGIGETQTTLLTHALIYDEEGVQTCIVKRPNTRLYITAYWTGSISVETIPELYKEGKAVLVDPDIALPWGGYIDYYFYTSARNMQYVDGDNRPGALDGYYWRTSSNTSLVTGDPREAVYTAIDKYGDKTWEARELYASGIVGGNGDWQNRYRDNLATYTKFFAHQYAFLDEPEELETYLCYVNNNPVDVFSIDSYSGNEHMNDSLFMFDGCFGYSRGERRSYGNSNDWSYPRGELSCSQFDISGLNMYNYITKEYDIDIPHHNVPDTIYDTIWYRANLELYVNYKGTSKYVYVFCNYGRPMDENGVPLWHITGFNNSNIVIAATDEYWDVDTYIEIPNLNVIPLELQRKKYYIVVGGTLGIIYPIIDYNRDNIIHRLTPTKQPCELSDDENGVLPRIISNRSYDDVYRYGDDATYADSYIFSRGFGSKPIVDNDKGYFLISYMLAFCNDNDEWTNYKLLVNGKYTGCPTRRWKTETGDKIVMFGSRVCSEWNGTGFTNVTRTYANNANNFSVFTISDMNTEPTREDITLTWNDPSVVSTTESHHLYSWSNKGYLVVAKRRTESEFIWVNVYGENGCELHTVENAKHARAIENTSYVVYQDMNLSEDTTYVFNIFDMSTETIVGVITISDGAAYTINGLCGYNDHVYISTTLNSVDSTIYYNIQTGAMESLTFSISYAKSNHLWYAYDTLVVDNKWVVAYVYNKNMYVYNGNIRESFFDTSSVHEYTRQYRTWLCCNTINEGKQLIFVAHGCVYYISSASSNFRNCEDVMIDMGAYLDGVDNNVYHKHYPRGYNRRPSGHNDQPTSPDVRFPFKDGIIWIRTNTYDAAAAGVGRIYWFPPEMCLPMHIKGTTKQLTSFNNPIKFSISAPFTYHITNDLSRLLPNNGG